MPVDALRRSASHNHDTYRCVAREQINKSCLFRLRVNAQGLGLKRSVTTLRGGTLGYAEIIALKVNRPHPPQKARHASRCRDPDGRPPSSLSATLRSSLLFAPRRSPSSSPSATITVVVVASSFFFSSYRLHCPCYHLSVSFVSRVCAGIRAPSRTSRRATAGSRRPSRSLASRCLVRCFRCSVLSLVYAKQSATPSPNRTTLSFLRCSRISRS